MTIPLDHIAQPGRPMAPFWWYGGKGNMARWIVPQLPRGKIYVEPFCGAASVFWHLKKPFPVEVLNDLDGEVVNLFRVLQDPAQFEAFRHRITWTLYSLDEFRKALAVPPDASPLDRAWAFFVRQNQGFSGRAVSEGYWSRVFVSPRSMANTTNSWRGRMKLLAHWHDRLTRVQLDNRDALEVIKYWDSPKTVFYLDPPYVSETRVLKEAYKHEVTGDFHHNLVALLLSIQGQAVLSGYPCDVYAPLEKAGWRMVERKTACHAAGKVRGSQLQGKGAGLAQVPRTEVLWIKENHQKEGWLFKD